MLPYLIMNEKPAVATDHGGLRFISATTSPPLQKDSNDALICLHGERVHR